MPCVCSWLVVFDDLRSRVRAARARVCGQLGCADVGCPGRAHAGNLPEFALRGLVHARAAQSSRRHSLRSRRRCGFASLACTRPRTESPWIAPSPALARFFVRVAGVPPSRMKRARPLHPRPSRTTTRLRDVARSDVLVQRDGAAPKSRMKRARPLHPRPFAQRGAVLRCSDIPGAATFGRARQREPGSLPGRVEDEAGEPVSSSTLALRPRQHRSERGPASAHSTDFPCEVWRMRGTRIRSGGATGGSDDARTECPSHAPDLVRQTPADCPHAHGPGTQRRRPRLPAHARPRLPAHARPRLPARARPRLPVHAGVPEVRDPHRPHA
jgi:hypothetical protein